jgi:hypothetical protein
VVQDGRRHARQSRRTLIDAQRQLQKRPEKILAELQTQKHHAPATGRCFHFLIAAAVLIQIVALQAGLITLVIAFKHISRIAESKRLLSATLNSNGFP